ncbi:MAG: hypothetical protein BGO98_48270 [Myxococcales bacterium 68-20]|nr:DUF4288 domain-containing protein [Myxococcales bacterium]OJY29637.1 MAG: hypothetical protein BGO98_48270 [Myxococcales bacterium 68-20]
MSWFSAKVRIACLVEGVGLSQYMDCLHIFIAVDFADAQARAIALGHTHEEECLNADNARVRWKFAEIVTLDCLGEELRDGVEVYSEPSGPSPNELVSFDHEFYPERSQPTQTI